MPRTLPEIRAWLVDCVGRWKDYDGTEEAALKTFLKQFVGGRFRKFRDRDESSGLMDLDWPDVAIVEIKAPSQTGNLQQHRKLVI